MIVLGLVHSFLIAFLVKVVCKELGLGYAQSGTQTHLFNGNSTTEESLSGVSCKGTEDFLSQCNHDATNFCPGRHIFHDKVPHARKKTDLLNRPTSQT